MTTAIATATAPAAATPTLADERRAEEREDAALMARAEERVADVAAMLAAHGAPAISHAVRAAVDRARTAHSASRICPHALRAYYRERLLQEAQNCEALATITAQLTGAAPRPATTFTADGGR